MKKFILLIIIALSLLPKTNIGQCNYNSTSPVAIGQVIADTAFCPSGGKITINNVTGGGGQYIYEIIAGPVIRIVQSQNIFNALPYGIYRVRVTGCNGTLKDTLVRVVNQYSSLSIYNWQQTIERQTGLQCGITNDGVYKISKPSYPGGTAPYRIQISSTTDFTAIPFQPGYDSAVFTSLNASTLYYVRVTDACNNFQTTNFTTSPSTPSVQLSVPALSFTRAYWIGSCSGNETMYINFLYSATGAPYNVNNTYSNKVFWGNKTTPYVRIKVENAVSGDQYLDRHISLNNYSNIYSFQTNYTLNGETGLAAPGTGFPVYGLYTPYANTMPQCYPGSEFPPNAPLKITLFYPGGDHCGTTIAPYTKAFYFNLGTHGTTAPVITAINNNCVGTGSYFKVDFNINYFQGKLTLVDPAPDYKILKTSTLYPTSLTYASISYSPLVIGHTYRVIVEDTCGRKDSANIIYDPGTSQVPPPVISDSVQTNYKCPVNANDTIYKILLKPLPAGYAIVSASIQGYGIVSNVAIPNWNGTTETGYKLEKLLPPGTYKYTIVWLKLCQTDSIEQTIIISPNLTPPTYSRALNLSIINTTAACFADGYTAIKIDGYLKTGNTGYNLSNLRLTGVPNSYVFPLKQIIGSSVDYNNTGIYYYNILSGDSIKLSPGYSGLIISAGQQGTYTFAIDVRCPNGTLVETISKSISVSAPAVYAPYLPTLKYSNALICDGGGTEAKINIMPVGGTRPFQYEYKLESAINYIPTGNTGTDSVVTISPAPAPGTIYDVRITDACGMTASTKVSVASFTGEFYMYQYPVDCINNPYDLRVGTSAINGAYYTWKRNGNIVAEGFNIAYVTLTGITIDTISVTVNMFDCYTRSATRVFVFTNPCNVVILPIKGLQFTGNRFSATHVQLNWQTLSETALKYFEIEKSTDGRAFQYVGSVNARNFAEKSQYSLVDADASEVVYYRIKIVDENMQITYSNVITVKNNINQTASLQVTPNPADNYITLSVKQLKAKTLKLNLYNDKGQLIISTTVNSSELITGKKINISFLPTGSYFLNLTDVTTIAASARFIKN
jgi:hypothetical protein